MESGKSAREPGGQPEARPSAGSGNGMDALNSCNQTCSPGSSWQSLSPRSPWDEGKPESFHRIARPSAVGVFDGTRLLFGKGSELLKQGVQQRSPTRDWSTGYHSKATSLTSKDVLNLSNQPCSPGSSMADMCCRHARRVRRPRPSRSQPLCHSLHSLALHQRGWPRHPVHRHPAHQHPVHQQWQRTTPSSRWWH